jgi:hypothetical protein
LGTYGLKLKSNSAVVWEVIEAVGRTEEKAIMRERSMLIEEKRKVKRINKT